MKKILSALIIVSMLILPSSVLAENDEEILDTTVSETLAPTDVPEETTLPLETEVPEETSKPEETSAPEETALPENTVTPTATPAVPSQELSEHFNLQIDINYQKYVTPGDVTIELYSSNNELLGSHTITCNQDTKTLNLDFLVPEYRMGEKFKVKLVSGLRSLKYYEDWVEPGGTLEVQTYGYLDENGNYIQNNGCAMSGNPNYEKELVMYVSGNMLTDVSPRARIVDGISMIPVRAIGEAMGLKIKYDPNYDSVVCSVGDKEVIFNAGSAYTTIFGNDTYAPHATVYIEGSLFVPVRTLAEAFESSLEVLDFGDHLDVIIGQSPIVTEYRNRTPVNKNGITSRTNYLVWVSKHEYKVRVYEGSQYNWELVKEYPCALGAWNTPTITGQFEYIERTTWYYPGYYVGPVLRFYNGYALHSTLLNYDGTEYDGRVGVNISHGCIRLHPQDITWIANTIPFNTRIYITE